MKRLLTISILIASVMNCTAEDSIQVLGINTTHEVIPDQAPGPGDVTMIVGAGIVATGVFMMVNGTKRQGFEGLGETLMGIILVPAGVVVILVGSLIPNRSKRRIRVRRNLN